MLDVSWGSAARQTQDMDLASHRQVSVAIRQDATDVKTLLLEYDMGFFEVPALNPKSPSTSFKLCGQVFHVDLPSPLPGSGANEPVFLSHFNSYAHPMRSLAYLLEDIQQATELLNLLLEDRPGDIWIALDAARIMQGKFQSQLDQGIEQLPAVVRQAVQATDTFQSDTNQ